MKYPFTHTKWFSSTVVSEKFKRLNNFKYSRFFERKTNIIFFFLSDAK